MEQPTDDYTAIVMKLLSTKTEDSVDGITAGYRSALTVTIRDDATERRKAFPTSSSIVKATTSMGLLAIGLVSLPSPKVIDTAHVTVSAFSTDGIGTITYLDAPSIAIAYKKS